MAQNAMISPPPQPQAANQMTASLPQTTNQTTASLPLSAVFQRLRQLKAWQHQQQDTLLRQQQEQLVKLRNEQAYQRNQVTDTSVGSNDRGTSNSPIKGQESVDSERTELTDDMYEPSEMSVDYRDVGDYGDGDVTIQSTGECVDELVATSPAHMSDQIGGTDEDRPIRPALRAGAATCFDDYVEEQLRVHRSPSHQHPPHKSSPAPQSFLKRGQGIARFNMKSKTSSTNKANNPTSTNTTKSLHSSHKKHESPTSLHKQHQDLTKMDSLSSTTRPGPESRPPYSERVCVRKVARGGDQYCSVESLCQLHDLPRESTPAMIRCSSDDSFIVRKTERSKWEEDELREFELLEQAAAELSLLSQTSQSHTSTHHTPPTQQAHSPQQWLPSMSDRQSHTSTHHTPPTPQAHSPQQWLPSMSDRQSHTSTHHTPPTQQAHRPQQWLPSISDRHTSAPQIVNDTDDEIDTSLPFTYPRDEDDPVIESDNELDNTLKASPPPTTITSLAAGIDFNDEESWESFNKSSPERTTLRPLDFPGEREQYLTSVDGSTEDLERYESSSIKVTGNSEHRFDDFAQPRGPVISGSIGQTTVPIVHASAPPEHHFYPRPLPRKHDHPPSIDPSHKPIPPPSVLISKLFPALRKETVKLLPIIQTPSPSQSSVDSVDSGKESSLSSVSSVMGDELRMKLAQLQTEIERYRSENGRLERLRKDKEEGLSQFKQEVGEFQRQKEEDVRHFEEYKREEIKKLKRERKMLETHQQEAKTARDKRDREEIQQLKKQLSSAREELEKRESRWSSTMARHRKRMEGLEARNRELQDDLRVMEQERLSWWQEQMEEKENRISKIKKQSPRATTTLRETNTLTNTQQTPPKTISSKSKLKVPPPKVKTISPMKQMTFTTRNTLKEISTEPQISDNSEYSFGTGSKGRKNEMEESCDSSELEIVDVISSDYDRGRSESPRYSGYQSDNELSMMADDIVSDVMCVEGAGHTHRQRHWSSPITATTPTHRVDNIKAVIPPTANAAIVSTQQAVLDDVTRRSSPLPAANDGIMTETTQADGSKVIQFGNGTRKVLSSDRRSLSVYFFNGDVKHVKSDQTIVYYYANTRTTHTTHTDGLQVLDFPNHQIEKHYTNGIKEITFPDKTVKTIHPSGEEESLFTDGNTQRLYPNGDLVIQFANGQRELHTKEYKRREYPDGTIKTVYLDGKQETRYSSGRVRIKDKTGRVVLDKLELNT